MGEVIYFPNAASQQPDPTNHAGLTQSEVVRLEAIRDNVEEDNGNTRIGNMGCDSSAHNASADNGDFINLTH